MVKLSQIEIARRSGLKEDTVSDFLKGRRKPHARTRKAIDAVLLADHVERFGVITLASDPAGIARRARIEHGKILIEGCVLRPDGTTYEITDTENATP
jgi:transcriptional regulator with XRE-family HTH domain